MGARTPDFRCRSARGVFTTGARARKALPVGTGRYCHVPGISGISWLIGCVTAAGMRGKLLLVFFYGDFQGSKELVVLRGQPNLARRFMPDRFRRLLCGLGITILFALIETDGCFEHQEDVVAGAFDFSDSPGDTVRIGQ